MLIRNQKENVSPKINKLTSEPDLDAEDKLNGNYDHTRKKDRKSGPLRSAGHLFKKTNSQTDRILILEKLVEAAKSVGVICCDNDFHGTGFMVGSKYVLTAFHVCKSMLGLFGCSVFNIKDKMETLLGNKACSVVFNIYRDHERNLGYFHIDNKIPFYDENLDIIMLEIKENYGIPFPPSLTNFGDLQLTDKFHFIGHPEGRPKERDADCVLLDIPREKADDIRSDMRHFLGEEVSLNVQYTYGDPYHGIDDPNRCFFNCSFEHAASGSPGITIDQNGTVKTCIVLLGGYPTFYWECSGDIKSKMPADLRFEFGIKLSAVYASLKKFNAALCDQVFQNCQWVVF